MPRLMFGCPSCGEEFASGIHTDARSLASVAHMPVSLQCPSCHRMHRVTARRGYLEEADIAPPKPRDRAATGRQSHPS
jgi:ribosomal protein L32